MLKSHNRYGFSPITKRPHFHWPNGSGVAFYIALNVEQYSYGEGLVEDLVPGMSKPDVLNSSWREYGTRVGAWRLLELFKSLNFPATILLNSEVCEHCPDLVAAMVEAEHEIAAHGRTNSESQAGLTEEEEKNFIKSVTNTISSAAGKNPPGWLSPWLAETELTPDLIKEAGYKYLLDWCPDDQAIALNTRSGALLSLPYSQEINDSAAIMGRLVSAEEFADMIIDQIDELLLQSEETPLVFGLALHANIMGQPFRLKHLRRALAHIQSLGDKVWKTRGCDIADFVLEKPEQRIVQGGPQREVIEIPAG